MLMGWLSWQCAGTGWESLWKTKDGSASLHLCSLSPSEHWVGGGSYWFQALESSRENFLSFPLGSLITKDFAEKKLLSLALRASACSRWMMALLSKKLGNPTEAQWIYQEQWEGHMVLDTHNNGYLIPKLGLQGQQIQDDIKHPAYSQY